MSPKSKRHKEPAKARQSLLEAMVDELLLSVLGHLASKQDLLSMCLVSRRLYNLAIEVLYRHLSLDLSAASHRRLLQRLAHPKACLPRRIQTLCMDTSWEDLTFQHCHNICALFYLMTNLKSFTWTGPLDALSNIPDILHARFPKAAIEVKDDHFYILSPDTDDDSEFDFDFEEHRVTGRATMTALLSHPVQSQITQITLFLSSYSPEVCTNFKKGLVGFLSNNQILRLISIRLRDYVTVDTHVDAFDTGKLAQPIVLDLGNTKKAIFTPEELKAWGKRGGWERLTSLTTGSADCFRCFIGCDVALEKLVISTTDDEGNDLGSFDEIFDSANTPVPFPDLRSFSCVERHYESRLDLSFMSVNILRWMPQLTHLILTHDMNCWISGRQNQELPTPQHIRNIRHTCPELEHLTIEMGLTEERPLELIQELARFSKPIKLNLFVLLPIGRAIRIRWRGYWRIARDMYHEQIYFENFKTGLGEVTIPQFIRDDSLLSGARLLDRMTDKQLEKVPIRTTVFGRPIRKHKHIVQEIKRREEDKHNVLGPDDFPTLYDAMMQRDA